MLVVRVELHNSNTGSSTEIARALIYNSGGTDERGDYQAFVFRAHCKRRWSRKDFAKALKDGRSMRKARVTGYPRRSLHVWHLIARSLIALGYN